MKKKPDCCPIVVVGAWNRAIFSPEWVQKYIFAPNEKFEIKIPQPHLIDASFQFVTPEFAFNIIGERLEFRFEDKSEKAVECLRNILRNLPHTPIASMGINCIYTEEFSRLPQIITEKLSFKEDWGVQTIASSIFTRLQINDYSFVNIRISNEASVTTFDFNYDFQIKESKDIFGIIGEDDSIVRNKEQETIELLGKIYNLKLD